MNVGVRPTFETGRGALIEAYLIDFDGDLYGETLRVAFVERLRGEKRFDSIDALVEQMKLDVERAREICQACCYGLPPMSLTQKPSARSSASSASPTPTPGPPRSRWRC